MGVVGRRLVEKLPWPLSRRRSSPSRSEREFVRDGLGRLEGGFWGGFSLGVGLRVGYVGGRGRAVGE